MFQAVGEAASSDARRGCIGGIHDLVDGAFGGRLIGFSDLVEDIPDLVRPAALDRNAGEDDGQGGQQAGAAVDQIMSRPSPVRPRRNRSVRKRSHSAALSLAARRKSMIFFLGVNGGVNPHAKTIG
jgi:hypothetical protein